MGNSEEGNNRQDAAEASKFDSEKKLLAIESELEAFVSGVNEIEGVNSAMADFALGKILTIYDGEQILAQLACYAANDAGGMPVVEIPPDHIQESRRFFGGVKVKQLLKYLAGKPGGYALCFEEHPDIPVEAKRVTIDHEKKQVVFSK